MEKESSHRTSLRQPLEKRAADLGTEDDDLEAMQREFLSGNTKPAAKVIRHNQPPQVISSIPTEEISQTPVDSSLINTDHSIAKKNLEQSNVLDFASSMKQAIKEFEVKERMTEEYSSSSIQTTGATSENSDNISKLKEQQPSKKLSLFAQRRLAKQGKLDTDKVGSTLFSASGTRDGSAHSSAATFLPKLMAPVPEHTVDEPVSAPQMKSRETGFPQIPVDYINNRHTEAEAPKASIDAKSPEYWAQVRRQVSQENEDRINDMSESEILEAQDDIRAAISSSTIKRLLEKKRNKGSAADIQRDSSIGSIEKIPAAAVAGDSSEKKVKRVQFSNSTELASESDNESDDDSEGLLPPPPPPPAEWVGNNMIDADDNSVGTDSEFYAEMRRKYFPKELVEDAKLAWILGHKQAKSPMEKAILEGRKKDAAAVAAATNAKGGTDLLSKPIAHMRFAFDGEILSEESTNCIPTTAGLHHHGDDPEKPGYTIPELLHLARSTVPAQRAVAIATLGCIIHRISIGAWDLAQSVEVYMCLLDWQAELYLSEGISDINMTGRVEATVALWIFVVEMAQYKTVVRLANGGQMEIEDDINRPGAEIHGMLPQPAIAKGVLIERTFKALDSMLSSAFMDSVYKTVDLSLVPERQLAMLSECIKYMQTVAAEFDKRIKEHGKLILLLENRFPYLMSKQ
ncbi:hypothetical protein GGI25_006292 [Coemansia spiralis]|uniref:RNA polymerase II-associated protein 1 N-terminal domain-containing protein n=2 Tax=Coemansia TaxID=4863 RepID=A0A9W8G314_9FUNG|nr:hypothetical protein EDC05_005161 [Coemansia umbellata]KAJ2619854.1 hypothetical protein GGI26_005473 [Coemansia sp. RSA 1358]KAJ2668985.1 hypothetical protein GGI25_006292 [Coemansia spiralis]